MTLYCLSDYQCACITNAKPQNVQIIAIMIIQGRFGIKMDKGADNLNYNVW